MNIKRESNGRFAKGWGRPVVAFNPSTYEMVSYNSISEAAKDGFTQSRISKCCASGKGKHRGFEWMYLEEHEVAKLWLG